MSSLLIAFYALIANTHAQIGHITCDGLSTCGPCFISQSLCCSVTCNLNCEGAYGCQGASQLICYDGWPCAVNCETYGACYGVAVAGDLATRLTVNCYPGSLTCYQMNVVANRISGPVTVNCNGGNGECSAMTIQC